MYKAVKWHFLCGGEQGMAVAVMGGDEKKPVFHDFLGMSCGEAPPPPTQQSVANEDDKNGGRLGGKVLLDDLRSERQGVNNSEVFHIHGRKNVSSWPESSYTSCGRKRTNTDSAYLCLAKDKMTPANSVHHDHSRNTKAVSEPLRRSNDFETIFPIQPPPRPASMTPCFGQSGTYIEKFSISKAMLSSQAVADEGSRTGIKSSGILNIINSTSGTGGRSSVDVFPSNSTSMAIQITEPAALNIPSRHRPAPAGRQMTIFYAGQAHVFDDVHPNKADVIMSLAGSSGGSWSTTYARKSTINPTSAAARLTSSKETRETNKALHIHGNPLHVDEVSRTFVTTEPLDLVPGGHSACRIDRRSTKSAELPDSLGTPDVSFNM